VFLCDRRRDDLSARDVSGVSSGVRYSELHDVSDIAHACRSRLCLLAGRPLLRRTTHPAAPLCSASPLSQTLIALTLVRVRAIRCVLVSPEQRRRNRARPRIAETACGVKVFFRPRNNTPDEVKVNLLVGYTQFCIAGLRESSPEERKMHQNPWRPGRRPALHWGAYSALQTARWWAEGLPPVLIDPAPPQLSPSSFEFALISFRRH